MSDRRPILCLDFDGVLHAYTSGWQGIDVVADGPTAGAAQFLRDAIEAFDVCIVSSRSADPIGRRAMKCAVRRWLEDEYGSRGARYARSIRFPEHKPPAMVTLDDRAITFTGRFPSMTDLLNFNPWTHTPTAAPGEEDQP